VCEAGVAMVTSKLSGLTMLLGGAQWGSEVPSNWISSRYSSHFPLVVSIGQSNSTSRLPRWPSGFPLRSTCQRTPGYICPAAAFHQSGCFQTNLEGEEQQTADILRLLHGRFTDHMTAEGGGAWWFDSVSNQSEHLFLEPMNIYPRFILWYGIFTQFMIHN